MRQTIFDTYDGDHVKAGDLSCEDWPAFLMGAHMVYVSPDLCAFASDHDEHLAADIVQADHGHIARPYRRLDEDWFVWLHDRITRLAYLAVEQPNVWAVLRARFNQLWLWTRIWWGTDLVDQLMLRAPDARYRPPQGRAAAGGRGAAAP